MTGKPIHYSYLDAAREVLRMQGGALHYESIGIAAVNLGLLNTKSRDPAKQMGVMLCQDVAGGRRSDFRRVRPGVFELAEHSNLNIPLGWYDSLGRRVEDLGRRLQLADDEAVLRRTLWAVRKCLELKGTSDALLVEGTLIVLEPIGLCGEGLSDWTRRVGDRGGNLSLELPVLLGSEYRGVARSLGVNLRTAVAFAVSLFERLLNLTEARQVKVKGEGNRTHIIWLR